MEGVIHRLWTMSGQTRLQRSPRAPLGNSPGLVRDPDIASPSRLSRRRLLVHEDESVSLGLHVSGPLNRCRQRERSQCVERCGCGVHGDLSAHGQHNGKASKILVRGRPRRPDEAETSMSNQGGRGATLEISFQFLPFPRSPPSRPAAMLLIREVKGPEPPVRPSLAVFGNSLAIPLLP